MWQGSGRGGGAGRSEEGRYGVRERVRDGEISMRHVKVVAIQRFRELGERDNRLLPPLYKQAKQWAFPQAGSKGQRKRDSGGEGSAT